MSLPTLEEFKKETKKSIELDKNNFTKAPMFECPKCKGNVYRDESIVYMTYPPKYKYFCKDCGFKTIF